MLQGLDWNGLLAAGGSVLHCSRAMASILPKNDLSFKLFYGFGDVDLFLYGFTIEQAEEKVRQIYSTIKQNIPNNLNITVVRSKHAITFSPGGNYPPVQVITRIYKRYVV